MLLVIHIGAGCHSRLLDKEYKTLLKKALAKDFFQASQIIELSPLTNTGYGSSLDLNGHASCDCSLFVHNGRGKLLSLHNVTHKHPTSVCSQILEELDMMYAKDRMGSLGLLRPAMLNYEVVRQMWDLPQENLILPKNQAVYEKFKAAEKLLEVPEVQDTVGLIEVGAMTRVAASSGGNILRLPSRTSCAGVFGAGSGFHKAGNIEVSCMCSGNGDDIIRMGLANIVAMKLAEQQDREDLAQLMVEIVQQRSTVLEMEAVDESLASICYVGVIAVIKAEKTRLIYCHSTDSFYFGFRSGNETEIVLSRGAAGRFVCGEFRL